MALLVEPDATVCRPLSQPHQPGGVKGLSLPLVRAPPNDLVILARGSATTHIRAAVCSGVSMQGFQTSASVGGVACPGSGVHQLRHYYASVLLAGGVDIKALSEYLGHHDPAVTLRIYAHLMPSAEGRALRAIEAAFAEAADDGPSTARDGEDGR
jgi:hypothetical protein